MILVWPSGRIYFCIILLQSPQEVEAGISPQVHG